MNIHKLEAYRNPVGWGWVGSCECSDPSYEDGWFGQVSFAADSREELEDYYQNHLIEVGES